MKIAVVGATGMVGQKFLLLLKERNFPVKELRLFASAKREGQKTQFRSQELTFKVLQEKCFDDLDIVFFSSGEEISQKWAPQAAKAGACVIDNSSAFRMQKNIPLVVPEVNAKQLKKDGANGKIIANPNCSTIQLVVALHPLQADFGLESVHIASYQSLSGAGRQALKRLKEETQALLNEENATENSEKSSFSLPADAKSSAFTCLPQIGELDKETGFSTEELKLMRETKKILGLPELKITATAVRVPTMNGHGEAVTVTLKNPADKEAMLSAFKKMKGICVLKEGELPHQRFVDGRDEVYVGRLREVPDTNGKSWVMWVAADNLRKGAALNGLQIAEFLYNS